MNKRVRKIADGAYFVPSYSEQTIVRSSAAVTNQAIGTSEGIEDENVHSLEQEPDGRQDFEGFLKRVSRKIS